MKYIKQLDSLRGIAVILVVIYHWLPYNTMFNTYPNRLFDVDIFFVLSGFLITNILFNGRNKAEELGISKTLVFKNFYLRRALRIFPAYYLTIFIIVILHISNIIITDIKYEFIYCLTYTINFYFYNMKYWGELTSHLWTLAVEEQFYLIWPFVILMMPKKYLLHAITVFIFIGVISQSLIHDMEHGYLPTYTCFDSFGLGALISWISIYKPQYLNKMYKVFRLLAGTSLIIFIIVFIADNSVFIPQQRTLRSLMAAWVISYIIIKGETDKLQFSFLFNNSLLIFLGKISYGIYLYHLFLPWDLQILDTYINKHLPPFAGTYINYIYFAENIILLILISWLSYRFFEMPILSLKKYLNNNAVKHAKVEQRQVSAM